MGMDNTKSASSQVDEIGALIQNLERQDYWKATVVQQSKVEPPNKDDVVVLNAEKITAGTPDPLLPKVLIVDKAAHQTHVLQMRDDGRIEAVLSVPNAVGKAGTPTPSKRWEISDKRLDPVWYPPKSIGGDPVPPFKVTQRNPIGLAFIRLEGSYGLHGTNRPDQIGRSVSHGCVRHNNEDILKIYPLVEKGTPVYTVNNFNGTKVRASDFSRRN